MRRFLRHNSAEFVIEGVVNHEVVLRAVPPVVEEGVGGLLDAADVESAVTDEAFAVTDLDVGGAGSSGESEEVVGE